MVKTRIRKKTGVAGVDHHRWSSDLVFVLAVSGATIGLNNIWEFPYLTYRYGGGAFLLVYVLWVLVLGFPLILAEILLGRSRHVSPVTTLQQLAREHRRARSWSLVGWAAMAASFLVFCYLCVIGGWLFAYIVRAGLGILSGQTSDGLASLFTHLVQDPEKQLFWHVAFLVSVLLVSARGLRAGLELAVRRGMFALFLLLAVLLVYAATVAGAGAALQQFAFDFSRITPTAVVAALGQAFFSLGLGVGVVMMYGAYLRNEAPAARVSLGIVALDTAVAITAAIIVFSLVLRAGGTPVAGPELIFLALPLAWDPLPFGWPMGTLFYIMAALSVWLSALALLEPALAWLTEAHGLSRGRAAVGCGWVAWALGVVVILSFNYWKFSFPYIDVIKTNGFFDILQVVTAQVLLPIGAMMIAVFVGWSLPRVFGHEAVPLRPRWAHGLWMWSMRVLTPLLVLIIFFNIHKLFL